MHAVHKNGKKSINLRDFPNDICFLLTEISTNFFFSFRMKFWDFRENVKFILDHMIRSGII
jgi:hypothetical protein